MAFVLDDIDVLWIPTNCTYVTLPLTPALSCLRFILDLFRRPHVFPYAKSVLTTDENQLTPLAYLDSLFRFTTSQRMPRIYSDAMNRSVVVVAARSIHNENKILAPHFAELCYDQYTCQLQIKLNFLFLLLNLISMIDIYCGRDYVSSIMLALGLFPRVFSHIFVRTKLNKGKNCLSC